MITQREMIIYHIKEAAKCIDDNWEKAGLHMRYVFMIIMLTGIRMEKAGDN